MVNLLIMNGLHTGPLLGHIPPSGREVVVIYSIIHRFEDGKLVEGVIISCILLVIAVYPLGNKKRYAIRKKQLINKQKCIVE